jgi:hypothetical protein
MHTEMKTAVVGGAEKERVKGESRSNNKLNKNKILVPISGLGPFHKTCNGKYFK